MRYNHCERDGWELTFSHTFIIVDNCEMRRFLFNAFLQTWTWALSWKSLLSFSWICQEKFREISFVLIFTGFFLTSCYTMPMIWVLRILCDCLEHRSTMSEWKEQSCLRLRVHFCTRVDPWDPGLIWFSAAFLDTECFFFFFSSDHVLLWWQLDSGSVVYSIRVDPNIYPNIVTVLAMFGTYSMRLN